MHKFDNSWIFCSVFLLTIVFHYSLKCFLDLVWESDLVLYILPVKKCVQNRSKCLNFNMALHSPVSLQTPQDRV